MAPPRIEVVGGIYHVNSKSVDGVKLFADESDYALYLRLLCRQARKSEWCVYAYTLMPNHFHVLLRLEKPTLSSGFQRLKSRYARLYNRRHGRRGALWQCRFFDSFVETTGHFYETIRYIALNAARANLCSRPEDWPWSGYASSIGEAPPDPLVNEPELLRLFAPDPVEARRRLKDFVAEADPRARFGQTRVRLLSDAEK